MAVIATASLLMSLGSFAMAENEKNEQLEDQAEQAGIAKAGTAFKRERNRVSAVAAIQDTKANAEVQKQILIDQAKASDDSAQIAAAMAGTTGASVQEVHDKIEFNKKVAKAKVEENELFSLDQLAASFSDFNLANQDARTKYRGKNNTASALQLGSILLGGITDINKALDRGAPKVEDGED